MLLELASSLVWELSLWAYVFLVCLHISSVVGTWYLVSLLWSNLTSGSCTENIKTKLSCPRPQGFPKQSSACSTVSSSTSHYRQCRTASVSGEQPSLHIQWSSVLQSPVVLCGCLRNTALHWVMSDWKVRRMKKCVKYIIPPKWRAHWGRGLGIAGDQCDCLRKPRSSSVNVLNITQCSVWLLDCGFIK